MVDKPQKTQIQDPIFNILIVGVGGQGVMKAGKFFQLYGASDPKIHNFAAIESRGVAQREGSVKAVVRYVLDPKYGQIPLSPSLLPQSVHLLIVFEPLELFRNIHLLRPDAVIFLNSQPLIPKNCVINTSLSYPDISKRIEQLKGLFPNIQILMKNYHQLALEQYRASVKSNFLILHDLIELNSKFSPIFTKNLYNDLLNEIFTE